MPSMLEPCLYATVKMVRVDGVTDTQITFSSRSSADNYESFTVGLDQLLVDPPTDAPTPVALTPGAIGYLYLSRDGWTTKSASGAALYKAGDLNYVLFKWPLCRPYRLLAYLQVKPTKIVVEGTNLATGAPIAIDVLGVDAAPAQDLDWSAAAPIVVKLSGAAAAANGGQDFLMIWPKRIVVEGASLQKPHISASLDVLDVMFGDFTQHLTWSEPGAPIDLKLSTTGFGRFKVTPQPIVYLARGLRVTYPEAIAAECDQLKDVDEEDVREYVKAARRRANALAKQAGQKKGGKKPKPAAKGASRSRGPTPRALRPRAASSRS